MLQHSNITLIVLYLDCYSGTTQSKCSGDVNNYNKIEEENMVEQKHKALSAEPHDASVWDMMNTLKQRRMTDVTRTNYI